MLTFSFKLWYLGIIQGSNAQEVKPKDTRLGQQSLLECKVPVRIAAKKARGEENPGDQNHDNPGPKDTEMSPPQKGAALRRAGSIAEHTKLQPEECRHQQQAVFLAQGSGDQ